MANKRAKVLTDEQFERVLAFAVQRSRVPESDRLKLLLSFKAGLRACEIARIKVKDLTDSEGRPARQFTVFSSISKGGKERALPMHPEIRSALLAYQKRYPTALYVAISSRRRRGRPAAMTANALTQWFKSLYDDAGLQGASSHSGRRTFGTKMARVFHHAGHSLVDVQLMLGHSRLDTTAAYIEPSDNLTALVHSI